MLSHHKINASALKKLGEARLFLNLMERSVQSNDFVYFLSAFLSALCSVTQPIKLQPSKAIDDRYRAWKAEMDEGLLKDTNLALLCKMRNGEVHRIPTEKTQAVGASFGTEGINLSQGDYVEIDFSSGKPVGRHKIGEAPVKTHPVTVSWHFAAPGDPDVLEMCHAGYSVVERVIASREAMHFD